MKLLSLFSGIGAFEKALERLGINYTLVNYCEVDKYASKAYSLIHNVPESLNLTLLSYLRFIKYYFRYYKTFGRFSLWMAFCNCSVYFRTHFYYLFVDFYFYKRLTN